MPIAEFNNYLWIALGGALGSIGRYGIGLAVVRLIGPHFPWGTLVVNIVGSFIIGYFGVLSAANGRLPAPNEIRLFVLVGFCGGFTTFSSFSLQTFELLRSELGGSSEMLLAVINVIASVTACLLAVWLGVALAER